MATYKTINGGLQTPYFEDMMNGLKDIECRLETQCDDGGDAILTKWGSLEVGDRIIFKEYGGDRTLKVLVVCMYGFRTFAELMTHFGYKRCMPREASLNDAVEKYRGLYQDRDLKFGVVGIEVKVID